MGLTLVCLGALAGCAATTEPVSNVGSTTASLNAQGRTDSTPGHYYFQFATAPQALGTGFGFQTPTRSVPANVPSGGGFAPFSESVSGLKPATSYFDRVCGGDGNTHGDVCANTRGFTTTSTSSGVAFASPVDYAVHSAPAAVAVANLQGLGDTDLVTANPSTNDVSVLLNQGDGVFAKAVNYATGNDPTAIAVGDFTGHGDDDVVTADGSGVSVLLGRGDGTLAPAVLYSLPIEPATSVVVGDFNGDGKQDIAAFETGGGSDDAYVTVLPGNGNGTFGSPINTPFDATSGFLTTGHFDSSGRSDLALGSTGTATIMTMPPTTVQRANISVLAYNGSGGFTVTGAGIGSASSYEANQLPALTAGPLTSGSSTVDLYFLEDEEAFIGSSVESAAPAYRDPGNGSDGFGPAQALATLAGPVQGDQTLIPTAALSFGHLSSHVNNDLAVSAPGQTLRVIPGNGNGTFQTPVPISSVSSSQGITAGDLNGDGKTDLAVGSPGGSTAQVGVLMNATAGY